MTEKELIRKLETENINFWDLIKNEYFAKDTVGKVKSLQNKGVIDINGSIISLRSANIAVGNFTLKKYKLLRKKFPLSDDFDQQLLTDDAIYTKLKILSHLDNLKNKNIVCIGDDDMFAIALALTQLPKSITVLDIDKRIINYENRILEKLGYQNSCIQTDLLKPIPSELVGKFDIFESEPPDNPKGHRLFISRGVQLLKNIGGVGYTGICDQTLSKTQRVHILDDISQMHGSITHTFEHCKAYETVGDEFNWIKGLPEGVILPTTPWFNSNLIRISFSKNKNPLITRKANLSYLTELSKIQL